MDARRRKPVACFRTSAGAGGARQAHMSTPSPDGTYVTLANQDGKLFERILTDYATNTFVHDTAAALDLAGCTTPNGSRRPVTQSRCPMSCSAWLQRDAVPPRDMESDGDLDRSQTSTVVSHRTGTPALVAGRNFHVRAIATRAAS
jgi:hypothetical protein